MFTVHHSPFVGDPSIEERDPDRMFIAQAYYVEQCMLMKSLFLPESQIVLLADSAECKPCETGRSDWGTTYA